MRPADRRFAYKETDRLLLQACRPHVSAPRLAHKLWDAAAQWGMLLDEASMLAYKAAVEACDPENSSLLETVRSLQQIGCAGGVWMWLAMGLGWQGHGTTRTAA